MREEKTLGRIVALNVLFMIELSGGSVLSSFEDIMDDIDGEFLYSLHLNPNSWDKKGHSAKKMMINLQVDYAINEIKRQLIEVYYKNDVQDDANFIALGIDSKDKFDIISSFEDILPFFPNNVKSEDLEDIKTVKQAGSFVIRKCLEVLGLSKKTPIEKYTEGQKQALKDWYEKDLKFVSYIRNLVFDFVREIVTGIEKHSEQIKFKIEANIKSWKYDKMGSVEKNILRLAVYEMMFSNDIPDEVIIEQAVVISKMFCEEKTVKFINGVLSAIYKQLNK